MPPTGREGYVFTGVRLFVHTGPHVTITHDALANRTESHPLDIRPGTTTPWTSELEPLLSRHQTQNLPSTPAPCPLLVTSGGHQWRPIQTCSFGDIWWWPLKLKHVWFPSGWYAPYWNASLLAQCNCALPV